MPHQLIKTNLIFGLLYVAFSQSIYSQPIKRNNNSTAIFNTKLNPALLTEQLEILASDEFAGRKFSSSESLLAQRYIISQLKKAQVKPYLNGYRQSFNHKTLFSNKQGNNIIGIIEGNKYPEHFIILTAHYDHLGKKSDNIYNGADDNASGVSAILAIASQLSQQPLNHSVIVLFTDAEEQNLLGAKAFAVEQASLMSKIKLNINLDMIAGNEQTRRLHYIDNDLDKLLNKKQRNELKALPSSIKLSKGFKSNFSQGVNRRKWFAASDHNIFYRAGIPFMYFGVGTHTNYHTPKDTFANINLAFYLEACQLIYRHLRFIDNQMVQH